MSMCRPYIYLYLFLINRGCYSQYTVSMIDCGARQMFPLKFLFFSVSANFKFTLCRRYFLRHLLYHSHIRTGQTKKCNRLWEIKHGPRENRSKRPKVDMASSGENGNKGQVDSAPYHWPFDGNLTKENTCIIVIDMVSIISSLEYFRGWFSNLKNC